MSNIVTPITSIYIGCCTGFSNFNVIITIISVQICMATSLVQQPVITTAAMQLNRHTHTSFNMDYVVATATISDNFSDSQKGLLSSGKCHPNRFPICSGPHLLNDVILIGSALPDTAIRIAGTHV